MTHEIAIADRFGGVTSSPVRDILSVIGRNDIISFAGGFPDPDLFPVEQVREASDWVLANQARRALQYATTVGEPELREKAAERLSRYLPTTPDHIQVTAGSQEGIFLAAQAIVDPGDVVLVERPTYLAAVQAFRMCGARMVVVDTDSDGILPDHLARLLAEHNPKLLYLIPNFQNPTGRTMPAERRRAVAEALLASDCALLEDDPYGEIRFEGEDLAPIASLPGMAERTLLLNSMSKVLAPGLRVAWMRGEGPVMKAIEIAKQAIALQSSVTDQLTVARFLDIVDLDAHIVTIRDAYRGRRDALYENLVHLWPEAGINKPTGGMFCWAALGGDVDSQELLKLAIEEGVAFVPGFPFFADEPDRSSMRLSYVTNAPERIVEGVARLSRAWDRYQQR